MANLQKDLAIINKYPVKPRALSARGGSAMKSGFGIRTNLKTAILSRLRQEFPAQLSTFLFESLPTLLVPVVLPCSWHSNRSYSSA